MNRIVYFAEKSVLFTTEPPAGVESVVRLAAGESISRAKIVKILETCNSVALVTPSPEVVFATFAAEFVAIEAAGGVVVNAHGEWLMIYRNGRWDLPKGHLEHGEQLEACAAREIAEETGVCAEVVRPLCQTHHAYYFAKTARWELKRTSWYALRTSSESKLTPQAEEGIECVAWCSPREVDTHLLGAFPTIRCVAAAMKR